MKKQTVSVSRVIKYFILLLLLLAVVSAVYKIVATMRYYKIYDYQKAVAESEYVAAEAWTYGTSKDIAKQRSVLTAPYDLVLSIAPNQQNWHKVVIDDIRLININNDNVVFNPSGSFEAELEILGEKPLAGYFQFNGLALEYAEYKIRIKFRLEGKQSSQAGEITLVLRKDYKEYWSNDIWDAMMSV